MSPLKQSVPDAVITRAARRCSHGSHALTGAPLAYQAEAAAQSPRFYLPPPLPATAGQQVRLGADEARHAARVLRLREVCPSDWEVYTARLSTVATFKSFASSAPC